MPIIFNLIGLGMGLAALVVGGIVAYSLFESQSSKTQGMMFSLVAGSMGIAMDVGYRMKLAGGGTGSLFNPAKGGSVFFIPIWIIGAFLIIYGIIDSIRDS